MTQTIILKILETVVRLAEKYIFLPSRITTEQISNGELRRYLEIKKRIRRKLEKLSKK